MEFSAGESNAEPARAGPVLRVADFSKSYDKAEAVRGLSFDLQPGAILGMVGPNGAGKTTTLRSITGILAPTSGRIEIDGHDISRRPMEAKRALAYVPDDPRLFDTLTVWDHLRFTARAYGVRDWRDKAEELLDHFSLREKKQSAASDLSRGMRQKTAICCALLHQPKLALFDEPLTGLDPRGIVLIKQTIQNLAQTGSAVILSSHLLQLVEGLCDHLLIMHRGRCRFFGKMEQARGLLMGTGESLEEVFLRLTESEDPADPDTPPPVPRS